MIVNYKLEMMWKEVVMACLKHLTGEGEENHHIPHNG
jgi:hypothetical protein